MGTSSASGLAPWLIGTSDHVVPPRFWFVTSLSGKPETWCP